MECSRCMELFSDYIDGGLDERTRKGVQEHLEMCAKCAGELRSLRACVEALASLDEEKASTDFLHRLHDRIERDERSSWLQWLKDKLFFTTHLKVPLRAAGLTLAALLLVITYQETKLRNVPVQSPVLAPAPIPPGQSPEGAQPAAPPSDQLAASSADRVLTAREPAGVAPDSNMAHRTTSAPDSPVHIVLMLPSRERGQTRLSHEAGRTDRQGPSGGGAAQVASAPEAQVMKQQEAHRHPSSVHEPPPAVATPALREKGIRAASRLETGKTAGGAVGLADEEAERAGEKDHDASTYAGSAASSPPTDATEKLATLSKDERVESAGVVGEIRKVVERLGGRLEVVSGGNASGEGQALTAHIPGGSFAVFLSALREMGRIGEPQKGFPQYSDREEVLVHLSIEYKEKSKY